MLKFLHFLFERTGFLLTLILISSDGLVNAPNFRTRSTPKQKEITKNKFHSEVSKSSAILIDVENVRGKSGFALSHADLLQSTSIWANHYGLDQRTSLVVDHGSIPSGYHLSQQGLSVIFAGSSLKADDVLVRDIPFFENILKCESLVVITADNELMMRCKRASSRRLTLINPISFLDDLERVVDEYEIDSVGDHVSSVPTNSVNDSNRGEETEINQKNDIESKGTSEIMKHMELEVHLGARLINAESQLRNYKTKKKVSPKKRKKLQKEANKIRAKLGQIGPSTLKDATSILSNGRLDSEHQRILLDKWELLRKSNGRKEVTGDRIILAERLRRELEDEKLNKQDSIINLNAIINTTESKGHTEIDTVINGKKDSSKLSKIANMVRASKMSPSAAHAYYVNSMFREIHKKDAKISVSSSSLDKISGEEGKEYLSKKEVGEIKMSQKSYSKKSAPAKVISTTLSKVGEIKKDQMGQESKGGDTGADTSNVRFVVVSDTHGCEKSLTVDNHLEPWITTNHEEDDTMELISEENNIPHGDVLLHLGDFAIDGPKEPRKRALEKFDAWLSEQPHATKIVVRGNHDPLDVEFPLSKATYVIDPTTIEVSSVDDSEAIPMNDVYTNTSKKTIKLAIVPYGGFSRSRKRVSRRQRKDSSSSIKTTKNKNLFPSWCDVLASHEPPRGVLDKCTSGRRAGNPVLRRAVESMEGDPPKLWLCGHIHEGRGHKRVTFGTGKVIQRGGTQNFKNRRETVVMNAANANPGRAKRLVHGALVVDVPVDHGEDVQYGSSSGKMMKTSSVSKPNKSFSSFVEPLSELDVENRVSTLDEEVKQNGIETSYTQMLLAIDLGLKCGASLYDESGKLVWYEQLAFNDGDDLRNLAPELLVKWENLMNQNSQNDNEEIKRITYLAIEGGYGEYFDAWSNASENHFASIQVLNIRPEEWRSHLLLPKEQSNSRSCKEAARLIARQIVSRYGDMKQHKGKFKTDVAESVAMGFFVAQHYLGWVQQQTDHGRLIPLIERYTNGQIVVPKK